MADELRRPQCKMCKTVCNVLHRKINSERKFIMKKKIIAITLAVSAMMSTVAFAENINANYTDNVLSFEQKDEKRRRRGCLHGGLCQKQPKGQLNTDIRKNATYL